MANTVVSGSAANAVRTTPGAANTNVPAGASTRWPSSSKVARPQCTRYSSSASPAPSCAFRIRSPTTAAVHALMPNDVIPKWYTTGRHGKPPPISPISLNPATAYPAIVSSRPAVADVRRKWGLEDLVGHEIELGDAVEYRLA